MKPSYTFIPPLKGKPNLVIKGGISEEILKAVNELDFNALIIKTGDWTDISSLVKYKNKITSLRIHCEDIDWTKLSLFSEVRSLEIGGDFSVNMDISSFSKLENLKIYWNKTHSKNLFKVKGLKCISLHHWNYPDLQLFSSLENLKFLELIDSTKITTLDGLEKLKKLIGIRVNNLRNLNDISAISSLKNLNYFHIEGCKKIKEYKALGRLKKLVYFSNVHSANFESLSVLKMNKNIDTIILGKTMVEDDDFSIIDELPELKVVLFKGSRNCKYNVKDVEKYLSEKWGAPMRQLSSRWIEIAKNEDILYF